MNRKTRCFGRIATGVAGFLLASLPAMAQEIVTSTLNLPLVGNTDTTTISLRNFPSTVWGADITLQFDQTVVEATAASATPGVCPYPDFIVPNSDAPPSGIAHMVVTQLHPSAPCGNPSDDVTVFTLEFRRIAAGDPNLLFTVTQVSDRNGSLITHTAVPVE